MYYIVPFIVIYSVCQTSHAKQIIIVYNLRARVGLSANFAMLGEVGEHNVDELIYYLEK